MSTLSEIKNPTHIKDLNISQSKELQSLLNRHGYNLTVDGIIGPKTETAFNAFKSSVFLGVPSFIGVSTIEALRQTRTPLKSSYDFSTKEGTVKAIIEECKKQGLTLKTQISYVLATVEHETNRTFKPVKEAYWLTEDWRRKNLRYFPYYGMGYSQLTWKENYAKYGKLLNIDLVGNPELALNPKYALFILVHGCKTGTFTGKKIEDYINKSKTDYRNARRVINGLDKADHIAALARNWESKI
jgi:predicted chitinase